MFDEIIITHQQRLEHLIGTNRRYVSLEEILNNTKVEQCYKTFFNAEVKWWIYEEQISRNINSHFDFKSDRIKLQLEEIDKILYQVARFDMPTIKSTILSTVTLRLNYLLRPRTALKWFVFRGEPTKQYLEIIKRLSYFDDYHYLISGFIQYVNDNKLLQSDNDFFSVLEFSNIIEKIDNDYLFSLSPEDFTSLLIPMIRFFNPGKELIDNSTMFPIESLIVFLDDKGIEPLKNKMEVLLLQNDIKNINGSILMKQIEELLKEMEQNPELYQDIVEQQKDIESEEEIESIDEMDIQEGYRDIIELSNELSNISDTINKLKKSNQGKKEDSEEK